MKSIILLLGLEMSRSSTARIEQRVRKKIEDGEFYEAHQMYRTIFSRQKLVEQFSEMSIFENIYALTFLDKTNFYQMR